MKCRFVLNENRSVIGVGRCKPHGQESCNESKEEQGRQQHVQTERSVEIKFVGQENNEASLSNLSPYSSSSSSFPKSGCVLSCLRINS